MKAISAFIIALYFTAFHKTYNWILSMFSRKSLLQRVSMHQSSEPSQAQIENLSYKYHVPKMLLNLQVFPKFK